MCMYGRCVCNTRQCARFVCLRLIHTNVQHFVFNVSFQFVVTVIVAVLFCFVESSSLFWLLVVCCVFFAIISPRHYIMCCPARRWYSSNRFQFVSNGGLVSVEWHAEFAGRHFRTVLISPVSISKSIIF